jgi:holo-[acyl-carrier protein] synthase
VIYGIGTDLVSIKRIEDALFRFGDRFLHRILTEAEVAEYAQTAQPARFLAKRFAAKEAFSKALGTGIGAEVNWHDVAVSHDPRGIPMLSLSVALQARVAALDIRHSHVSISDESEHAIAFVVMETSGRPS